MAVAVKRCRWQPRIFRAARIANGAGTDAIHPDTVFTILPRQGTGQTDQRLFARRIPHVCLTSRARGGCDQENGDPLACFIIEGSTACVQ